MWTIMMPLMSNNFVWKINPWRQTVLSQNAPDVKQSCLIKPNPDAKQKCQKNPALMSNNLFQKSALDVKQFCLKSVLDVKQKRLKEICPWCQTVLFRKLGHDVKQNCLKEIRHWCQTILSKKSAPGVKPFYLKNAPDVRQNCLPKPGPDVKRRESLLASVSLGLIPAVGFGWDLSAVPGSAAGFG